MRLVLRAAAGCFCVVSAVAAQERVSFNRDIRPIMSDTCFRCHGPDKNARMAGMRLDIRDEALKPTRSGRTPIVPGDPDKSEIVARIFASGAKVMPPVSAHKELTGDAEGHDPPVGRRGRGVRGSLGVSAGDAAGGARRRRSVAHKNPIDAFIQDRLRREGLDAGAQADRAHAAPPRHARSHRGAADAGRHARVPQGHLAERLRKGGRSPAGLAALRRAADDALARRGALCRHLRLPRRQPDPRLALSRLRAARVRDNKPFDEFTREQLAGDLLPNATLEQRVASAYNRLNRTSAEGGLQPKEYLAKYGADRVRTLSAVWLGSTIGCAECHDHKFDPFLAKDFYSMKAFFADIKETGLVPDRGVRAWGAQVQLPSDEQKRAARSAREPAGRGKGAPRRTSRGAAAASCGGRRNLADAMARRRARVALAASDRGAGASRRHAHHL